MKYLLLLCVFLFCSCSSESKNEKIIESGFETKVENHTDEKLIFKACFQQSFGENSTKFGIVTKGATISYIPFQGGKNYKAQYSIDNPNYDYTVIFENDKFYNNIKKGVFNYFGEHKWSLVLYGKNNEKLQTLNSVGARL